MNTYNIVNFRVAGAKPWIVSCSTGKSFALFAVLQESYTSYYFTIINNDNKREIKIDKREIREREREKERDRERERERERDTRDKRQRHSIME